MGKFEGKVVLVTGASNGIGAATAIEFVKQGAKVVITGRCEERLKKVGELCRKEGSKNPVLEIKADLNDFKELNKLVDKTVKHFGSLDILVNNAGYGLLATLDQLTESQYDGVQNVNLKAPVFLCKHALPHLRKTKGSIINISSTGSKEALAGYASYAIAKAGLDHFTRNLASECAPHGVRVNVINPGYVKTGFLDAMGFPEEVKKPLVAQATKQQSLGAIEPEEIADGILFLASHSKITGISLVIDGGRGIRSSM